MKNDNLKLVELNTKELKQIEGGFFFLIPFICGIVIGWGLYEELS
jgi:bacteriocin-like protein